MSNAAEVARVVNVAFCTGLIFTISMRTLRDWPRFSYRHKIVRIHLVLYLVVLAYGTIESLRTHVAPGFRILLLLIVNVSFAVALYRDRDRDHNASTSDRYVD